MISIRPSSAYLYLNCIENIFLELYRKHILSSMVVMRSCLCACMCLCVCDRHTLLVGVRIVIQLFSVIVFEISADEGGHLGMIELTGIIRSKSALEKHNQT